MTRLLVICAGAGAVLAIVGALTIPEDPACILLLGVDCPPPTPVPELLRNAGAAIFVASMAALVFRTIVQARARVAPEAQGPVPEEPSDPSEEGDVEDDGALLRVAGSETDARLGDLLAGLLLMAIGLFFLFLEGATAPLDVSERPAIRLVFALAAATSFVASGICRTGFQLERETGRRWSLRFGVLGVMLLGAWAAIT